MSAAAEVIEHGVVDRHRELCEQLSNGVVAMCSALWRIRGEKTYRAQGCGSFGEFLKRAGISAATGRMYADLGPALLALQRRGKGDLVKHAELLKPIHKMIAKAVRDADEKAAERVAEKQAQLVVLAAQVAERSLIPLTADVIEEVAERNYHWLPARKRKAQADAEEVKKWEHPFRQNVRAVIECARAQLSGIEPSSAVDYAAVHRLEGFMDLAQWFIDVVDEAQRRAEFNPELFD